MSGEGDRVDVDEWTDEEWLAAMAQEWPETAHREDFERWVAERRAAMETDDG